jgi:hypothetical protein
VSLGSLSNGWIFIDKPKGITSFDVIRKVIPFGLSINIQPLDKEPRLTYYFFKSS